MKWHEGRQGTGYRVLTLFESKRLKCDLHIIKVEAQGHVPEHLDAVGGDYEHHRVNMHMSAPQPKSIVYIGRTPIVRRIYRFRPDIQPHGVTRVRSWPMWILSFGWLKKVSIPT